MNKNKKIMIICGIVAVVLTIIIISGIAIANTIRERQEREERERESQVLGEGTSGGGLFKPIIYLYPKQTTDICVKLGKIENVTCIYPKYNDGWYVTAYPDGTLVDKNTGRTLYSLYWEGIDSDYATCNEGFVVKGSDTAQFLEEKLSILGLTDREAEEFIIYWLPKLQNNEYNYIRFATMEEINEIMPLEFSVEPDTLIRVLMEYKPLDNYIDVKEQELTGTERKGFVAVEWGGTELK